VSRSLDGLETSKLREEVASLSERLDKVLQHFDNLPPASDAAPAKVFEEGLPLPSPLSSASSASSSAADRRIENSEPYRRLLAAEVDPDHARKLAEDYVNGGGGEPFVKWLETAIRCAAGTSTKALGGRKVMLLGPTGVGKTTTIAKLAAIQALWEHKNVLLLTSDTYRIAAVDQLRTYAKILGVPIEVVFEVESFPEILAKHANADLVLLDTAGRGQRDRKSLGTCELLYNMFKPDAVHLVLSANMKYRDMRDVVKRMSIVPISHVIFTKLDETVSYGALFNVLKFLDRPVSFFTTGQNVPNDIEVASAARFVRFLTGTEAEEGLR
jgi:flagellar biosynthesis protein FlhF